MGGFHRQKQGVTSSLLAKEKNVLGKVTFP